MKKNEIVHKIKLEIKIVLRQVFIKTFLDKDFSMYILIIAPGIPSLEIAIRSVDIIRYDSYIPKSLGDKCNAKIGKKIKFTTAGKKEAIE